MGALIVVSLVIVYTLTRYDLTEEHASIFMQALPSSGVGLINILLMFAATKFGEAEYHLTKTDTAVSQTSMMTVAMVLNSAFVLLLVHRNPKDWYKSGGLVRDIYYMLAINFFFPPLMFLMDYEYALKWLQRRRVTPGELKALNTTLAQGESGSSEPAATEARGSAERRAQWLREQFEPTEMDVPRHHANAEKTFFCCLLYMPLIPLATLIGFFSLLLQYAVDKWMLLRYCRRPAAVLNASYSRRSMTHVRFAASLGLPLAMEMFLQPSWASPEDLYQATLMSLVPGAILCLLPVRALARLLLTGGPCQSREDGGSFAKQDYYEAQHMWPREGKYHKSHFFYARLPEDRNPELLSPLSTDLSVDDFRRTYGVLAPEEARDPTGALGLALGAGVAAAPEGSGLHRPPLSAGGAGPFATAESIMADTPAEGDIAAEGSPAPPSMPVVWDFEARGGFEPFDADCQDFIEMRFSQWRGGGRHRVRVCTRNVTLSVDFAEMTSMLVGSSKIRTIRRREMPLPEAMCTSASLCAV
uniref:WWE domain-containing protein n=1 Tax=Pyrodinium bahamense TaxID=73915 RepID=A0A7S0FV12_9DINO